MRRFSFYQRNGVYYARFWNEKTKKYSSGISTGERELRYATARVVYWEAHGIPSRENAGVDEILEFDTLLSTARAARLSPEQAQKVVDVLRERGLVGGSQASVDPRAERQLLDFLTEFWDYDRSPYVREKHAFGHSLGRRHCYEQAKRLHHWREAFGEETRICDVTREDLHAFQLNLRSKLAPKTANTVLAVGSCALAWATEQKILVANPAEGLRKFSGPAKKRGILSASEAAELFERKWEDQRARVGNMVAMTCGLRSGEVLALKAEDIGEDRLHVRHSWSFTDGLKCPKNGETRSVPLLPQVRAELLKLIPASPFGNDGFIFYGVDRDKPMNPDVLTRGLQHSFIDLHTPKLPGETPDEYAARREKTRRRMLERGICFHSWRHFYATYMADHADLRTVQLATGHKSAEMAKHYADHSQDLHFQGAARAAVAAFGDVLRCNRKVAS